jgi:hypothetical protein
MMAILLLVVVVVASVVRYAYAPFELELADGAYRGGGLSTLFAAALLIYCGFIAGKMFSRSGLSATYSTLSMPIYGVLACGVFVAPNLLDAAAASLCFEVALFLLLRSLHRADEKDSVFFASMLLGVAALLYPPCIILVAVLPIAIFTLALSLRQSLIMIVGYLLPLLVASYVVWYGGESILHFGQTLVASLLEPQSLAVTSVPYLAIAIVASIVAILLWGVVYSVVCPSKAFTLTRVRRALHLFLWIFVLSLAMPLVPSCDLSACAIIAVPATMLLSYVLGVLPNNHSTIAYWVLLALFATHLFVA